MECSQEGEARSRAGRRPGPDPLRIQILIGIIAAVVVALVVGVALLLVPAPRPGPAALPTPPAAIGVAAPPWPAPADPTVGIEQAGLTIAEMTGNGAHFHTHLDISVNGKTVPVPANVGINATTGAMSVLHTHDASGVLHIEADQKGGRYVLGQLFTEWGVRLDSAQFGSFSSSGDRSLAAYVDGRRFRGNPAQIELLSHRQIALVYGTAAQQKNPPSTYKFPRGE